VFDDTIRRRSDEIKKHNEHMAGMSGDPDKDFD